MSLFHHSRRNSVCKSQPPDYEALDSIRCGSAGVCETAAALLGVADEAGLSHLRAVALDFVVMHFDAVAKTGAWAGLPRACADAVAAEVLTLL